MKAHLHIPEPLLGAELALWFKPVRAGVFDETFPPNFFETSVERATPEAAKAIVLPNNFKNLDAAARAYIAHYADLGQKLGIPVYVFSLGDFTDRLRFDSRVTALTFSVYRSQMAPNMVVMPTLTEDMGAEKVVLRQKSPKPTVSFCGMAGFPSATAWTKYYLKLLWWDVAAFARPKAQARKLGVYWRRAAMRACKSSGLVDTFFIIRKSFSGNRKSIELDPTVARKEYRDTILNSDFVIAPKGDGNYSNRFLEALSMGRIPVLIDTDAVLPLENVIEYAKIAVTVPMSRVRDTAKYVREFYDTLTEEEWHARQQMARAAYTGYLRQDSFLQYFFNQL